MKLFGLTIPELYRWVRGLLNKRRSHDGKRKYSLKSAKKAKEAMEKNTGRM